MDARVIDLNADLGESYGRWRLGDDEAMLEVVTSANVACGFHAGDPLTLRRTCAAAAAAGVSIGAQVSYNDLVGFGRRRIQMPADELTADVLYQLAALDGIARTEGAAVAYVKPHGALYNTCVTDGAQAAAVVAAVVAYVGAGDPLPVLGLPGSRLLAQAAAAELPCVREAFADRGYARDGTLLPRDRPGALLTDPNQVADRVAAMVVEHTVTADDGSRVEVAPDSICLHGDTDGAAQLALAVRDRLTAAGVELRAFASVSRERS